jgi:TP901 family phage tail tape measure protein
MTTPSLALGISAAGAQTVADLAAAVGNLKNNLTQLGAVAGGSNLANLDALTKEFREMRQELVATMQGLRTDLAAGMQKAYDAAAAQAKAGAAKVEEEVKKGAARVRVAAKAVNAGNGLSFSTSGKGVESLDAVALSQQALLNHPSAVAARMDAERFAMQEAVEKFRAIMKEREAAEIAHNEKMKAAWLAYQATLAEKMGRERFMMEGAVAQFRAVQREREAAEIVQNAKLNELHYKRLADQQAQMQAERAMMAGPVAQFRALQAEREAAEIAHNAKLNELHYKRLADQQVQMQAERAMMDGAVAQFRAAAQEREAAEIAHNAKLNELHYKRLADQQAQMQAEKRMMDGAVAQFRARQDETFSRGVRGSVGQAMSGAGAYSSISAGSYGALHEVPVRAAAASTSIRKLTVDLSDAHSAARGLASGFGAMWLTWGSVAPLLAGAALSHSFVQVIKLGSAVQQEMETIRVLSEESTVSVGGLNAQLLEMARTGPFGPLEVAKAMKTLSLAGLDAKEVSTAITDVLHFAVAGDTSIEKSADVLTTVGTAFKISAKDYNYIGDVIAKTAAVSKASVETIGEAFKSASVINSQYGVSLKDVGVGLAILNNVGVKGSAAGTALRNFYVDILGRTPKVEKSFRAIGLAADFAFDKATGKARGFIPIITDLTKALDKYEAKGQTKALQDQLSERGGKVGGEAVALIHEKMKSAKSEFANDLLWMQAQIEASAGFMSISFAQMQLTTTNQMKSTVAALQASLVKSFDAVQPYVLSTAQQLKAAFNSEEFQSTISGLVRVVGNLTLMLVENADKALLFVGALMGLKVLSLIESLFAAAGARALGMTAALFGNAAAAKIAAGANSELALAYEKRAIAETAAAAATNGAAAASGGMLSRLGSIVAIGTRFLGWIGIAIGAWQLYEMYTGKADDATKKKVDHQGALLDALKSEADRLNDINRARLLNITLEEMQLRKRAENAKLENAAPGEALRAEADRMRKLAETGPAVLKDRRLKSATALDERAELEASAASSDAVFMRRAIATQETRIRTEAEIQAKATEDEMRRRQIKPPGLPYELPGKDGKTGKGHGPADPSYNGWNELTTIDAMMRQRESVLKTAYDNEKQLLDAKHQNDLISEGTYQAEALRLTEVYEEQAQAVILGGLAKERDAVEKRKKELAGIYSNDDLTRALESVDNDLKRMEEAGKARMENIKNGAAQRQAMTVVKLDGELRKLQKTNEEYWKAADLGAQKESAMTQVRLLMIDATEEQRAGMEAMTRVAEQHAPHIALLQKEYAKVTSELEDFTKAQENDEGTSQAAIDKYAAMKAQVQFLAKALQEATGKVVDLQTIASSNAVIEAQAQKYKQFSDNLKSNLADALLDAGKDGGAGLRRVLEEELLRKPFKMIIEAMIQPLTNDISKGILGFVSQTIASMGAGAAPEYAGLGGGPKNYNYGGGFDGGGYTGDGSRSGGMDGKGGFMAMLHPQETVIDHTRGQGMGGDIEVVIHNYGGGKDPQVSVQPDDARGRRRLNVTLGESLAGEISRPGSAAHSSVRKTFGTRPTLVGR